MVTNFKTAINTTPKKLWLPKQVLITPDADREEWGQQILERIKFYNIPIKKLTQNKITGLRGQNERETYALAKNTLAIVNAPASQFKLSPIPPSADWQFHLAQGCPAHCQYCYLAGSLSGVPVVKVYANLPQILANLSNYEPENQQTTYEVSCYTDPLSIEHLTGSLAECIRYFGTRKTAYLRWVTKFDYVEPLLNLPHNKHTRCRVSINADPVSHLMEGGTATVSQRLQALRQLSLHGYPIGIVIAPIMAIADWEKHYTDLFELLQIILNFDCDLTVELITHRFTPKSKEVLQTWYPKSILNLEEDNRARKYNKFGGVKYVYEREMMTKLREFIETKIKHCLPQAKILYWT